MKKNVIHCPVNDWDCPYYASCCCTLDNPYEDCDDYFAAIGEKDDD